MSLLFGSNEERRFRWDDRGLDTKIVEFEGETARRGLSIWGTDGCEQCGACCYALRIDELKKREFEKCKYLETNGTTNCRIYGSKKRPEACSKWECWGANAGLDTDRMRFVFIAIEILKSKNLDDLKGL